MTSMRRLPSFVCLVSVLALLAGASPTFAISVEEIPTPRPAGWSVDLTGTLSPEARQEIDRLGDQVKATNGAEIAVVVIDSTGGVPSREFATRLFEHWGIGESGKDDGLLLFAALGDRSAEIVLGRGLDNPANNQMSEEVMQGEIIPLFRAGDPAGALFEGARACARRILGVAPPVAESATPMPPLPPRTVAPTEPMPEEPAPVRTAPKRLGGLFMLSILGATLAGVGYFLMRTLRCPRCRVKMTLMSEQEDDAHLTSAERTEERIGAVEHEIWLCLQCGETRKKSWARAFSGFSRCDGCGAKAVQSTFRVIESPTYSSSGTRRVDTSCAHCSQKQSYTVAIPRLEEEHRYESSSSSSSSRSFRSHSSSSSSSSSSRSSSRGSGFGGGRSSGGGASGKW